MRCLVSFGLWVVAASALAGAPDYDAFSEPDGEIATVRQELAAWRMLRDPEQLEAVYADAVRGMPRAVHVMQQLEATLAASGREVAERSSRPGIGQTSGCHTCGIKDPGTKSRHFIPDHQPASATVPEGTPQRLYPQCINCSREQGLELARQKRGP